MIPLEDKEIYTITIIRNIGIPISFTVKKWKLFALLFLLGGTLLFTTYFSVSYIFVGMERNRLFSELNEAQKKIEVVFNELSRTSHEKYTGLGETIGQKRAKVRAALTKQPEIVTKEILTQTTSHLTKEDVADNFAMAMDDFKFWRKRNVLYFSVLLKNISKPLQVVGGYITVTLSNEDVSPSIYVGLHGEELGKNGYPSNYKSGGQYYLTSRQRTKKFKYSLKNSKESYSDVEFFLYSYRGRLVARQRFELDKELFDAKEKKYEAYQSPQKKETKIVAVQKTAEPEPKKPETTATQTKQQAQEQPAELKAKAKKIPPAKKQDEKTKTPPLNSTEGKKTENETKTLPEANNNVPSSQKNEQPK